MPRLGWRSGRGVVETAPADRLTAERLADFLSSLGSDPVELSMMPSPVGGPEDARTAEQYGHPDPTASTLAMFRSDFTPPADEPLSADVPAPAVARAARWRRVLARVVPRRDVAVLAAPGPAPLTASGPAPAVFAPAVFAPAVFPPDGLVPDVLVPDVHAPDVHAPDVPVPAVSKVGRHRPPGSAGRAIRGFALTSRRLALIGALLIAFTVLFAVTVLS